MRSLAITLLRVGAIGWAFLDALPYLVTALTVFFFSPMDGSAMLLTAVAYLGACGILFVAAPSIVRRTIPDDTLGLHVDHRATFSSGLVLVGVYLIATGLSTLAIYLPATVENVRTMAADHGASVAFDLYWDTFLPPFCEFVGGTGLVLWAVRRVRSDETTPA